MPCFDENIAVGYASGSLQITAAEEVEAHAAGCRVCRGVLSALARTVVRPADLDEATLEPSPALEAPGDPLAGHPRFRLVRPIGEGGMGIVYEALDLERNSPVALKTLQRSASHSLVYFKHEFRALQSLHHRNLVSLGELFEHGGRWFFTMELIRGVDFLAHVRPEDGAHGFDEGRLRSALPQVAEALGVLHGAGKVHRDIKPSNVLVTAEGRPVLVDFGLVAELEEPSLAPLQAGTLSYMAPEQTIGKAVGAPSDLYSLGVMLYVALTGTLPFQGSSAEIRRQKREVDPPSPRTLNQAVPADLDSLCCELLQRDPSRRPTAGELLQRFGMDPAEPSSPVFVGRQEELFRLRKAWQVVLEEATPQVVVLRGESGVGKTALAQWFLGEIRRSHPQALCLSGRCYERESVPFKAFDELVDALSRRLSQQPPSERRLPPTAEMEALSRLFPVLRTLVDEGSYRFSPSPETRTLAFRAFEAFLQEVGAKNPLLFLVDDLQWADGDSFSLLEAVARLPSLPLLLVATARSDFGRSLPEGTQVIPVGGLERSDARDLARLMGDSEEGARVVAEETAGHPLFIRTLSGRSRGTERTSRRLDEALWSQVLEAGERERGLLELLSLAAQPLSRLTLASASGLGIDEVESCLLALRATSLVRTDGPRPADTAEPYHDRIRQTVAQRLEEGRRLSSHQALARALEGGGEADPASLAFHWREAGEPAKASECYRRAAEQARAALAFEREAELYRQCLALLPPEAAERPELRVCFADALAASGRGLEAGEVYRDLAQAWPDRVRGLELRRRACEQLLRVGALEEGQREAEGLFRSLGLRFPRNRLQTALSILADVVKLQLERLRPFRRDPGAGSAGADPLSLARIDTCWSVSHGLTFIDPARAVALQVKHLRLSLRAAEPYRMVRALALEGAFAAAWNPRTSETRFSQAERLAGEVTNPHAQGVLLMGRSVASHLRGQWEASRSWAERAESLFRARCENVVWEVGISRLFRLQSLAWMGRVSELSTAVPLLVQEARDHGDLFAATAYPLFVGVLPVLAADRSEQAALELERGLAAWPPGSVHLQHLLALLSKVNILLYQGRGTEARDLLRGARPDLRRSGVLRMQLMRLDTLFHEGLVALASLPVSGLGEVERYARRILRERVFWATPMGKVLQAGVFFRRGDRSASLAALEEAWRGFEAAEMGLHAASAALRLGRLQGGPTGGRAREAAEAFFSREGFQQPERMAAIFAPGFSP